jgi:transposase
VEKYLLYLVLMLAIVQKNAIRLLLIPFMYHIIIKTQMVMDPRQHARRRQALSAHGATHPHPEAVTDPLFRDSAFFDPDDLVQVKYEMLRSVQKDGRTVVEAAQAFGLSRPAFYVTQGLFEREGLPGLLPRKRGPKRPHKLTDEALAVLAQAVQEAGRMLNGEELAALLAQRFGIEAHPRSVLRRLRPYLQAEKKRR